MSTKTKTILYKEKYELKTDDVMVTSRNTRKSKEIKNKATDLICSIKHKFESKSLI